MKNNKNNILKIIIIKITTTIIIMNLIFKAYMVKVISDSAVAVGCIKLDAFKVCLGVDVNV